MALGSLMELSALYIKYQTIKIFKTIFTLNIFVGECLKQMLMPTVFLPKNIAFYLSVCLPVSSSSQCNFLEIF